MSDGSIRVTKDVKVVQVVAAGISGPTGPQGDIGPTGAQGSQGEPGVQGLQGVQGDQGDAGVDINWRGDWLVLTSYQFNDAVRHLTSSWVYIDATPRAGEVPGTSGFWSEMNQDGATGSTGATGSAGATGPAGPSENSKSMTVENPSGSEDLSMFFTDQAITITRMRAVLRGSSTPSVTWTVRHEPDRSAAGNEVVTGGTETTSTTTGSNVTSFDDASIPANSWIWLETTAQSGTVDAMSLTLDYDID